MAPGKHSKRRDRVRRRWRGFAPEDRFLTGALLVVAAALVVVGVWRLGTEDRAASSEVLAEPLVQATTTTTGDLERDIAKILFGEDVPEEPVIVTASTPVPVAPAPAPQPTTRRRRNRRTTTTTTVPAVGAPTAVASDGSSPPPSSGAVPTTQPPPTTTTTEPEPPTTTTTEPPPPPTTTTTTEVIGPPPVP